MHNDTEVAIEEIQHRLDDIRQESVIANFIAVANSSSFTWKQRQHAHKRVCLYMGLPMDE